MPKNNNELNLTNYPKANILISAKYDSDITEDKLFAIALSDESRMKTDKGGTIRVSISAAEIKKALKGNKGSTYALIKDAAKSMNNRQLGIIEDKTGQFAFFQVIQSCIYADGELNITFNSDLSKYIKNLKENFTILNLETMCSFKSHYAFRLYELVRSKAYNRDKKSTNREWKIKYSLSELQLQLGVVNAEDDNAKKILSFDKNPDYEKAVEIAKDKKKSLIGWREFKRQVLDVAIKEINEKSEIEVSYDVGPYKKGKGGKITGMDFTVRLKEEKEREKKIEDETENVDIEDINPKTEIPEEDKFDFVAELKVMLKDESFTTKELITIAEASSWNMETCRNIIDVYKETGNIKKPVGWLIKAVTNPQDYTNKINHKKKGAPGEGMLKHNYDYDEMEKILLGLD